MRAAVPVAKASTLSAEEVQTFMDRGFIIVRGGLDRELAEEWVAHSMQRLGFDGTDPSTWGRPRDGSGLFLRLEPSRSVPLAVGAPIAYGAICDLVGGEERLDVATLTDTMIMNMGGNRAAEWVSPAALARSGKGGWHKDGWHFKHFLDSPDQALLVTALFSDVMPGAGGTFIAADSPSHVARWLAANPQGCGGDAPAADEPGIPTAEIIARCEDFVELTGQAGDVVLMHPFMLHTVSVNPTDHPRIITNPAPTLREPMRFDRFPAPSSPVEMLVLRALGTHTHDFVPTTPRESNFVPHHMRGRGERELVALLQRLNVTFAAAGDSCRNTLPSEEQWRAQQQHREEEEEEEEQEEEGFGAEAASAGPSPSPVARL
jgi:hypothetical protein